MTYQVILLGRSGKESRNELLDKGLLYRWCLGQTCESLTHLKTVLHKSLSASTLYLCDGNKEAVQKLLGVQTPWFESQLRCWPPM